MTERIVIWKSNNFTQNLKTKRLGKDHRQKGETKQNKNRKKEEKDLRVKYQNTNGGG